MYIAGTSLHGPVDALVATATVRDLIIRHYDPDQVEHFHVRSRSGRIDITVFVTAAGQSEADTLAHRLSARLCGELPGWRPNT